MASYTIIGGDNKEYGPISVEDIRQWISEGRLSAQSMVKSDADVGWRALGTLPEFADAFKTMTPPPIAPLTPAGGGADTGSDGVDFLNRDYEMDIGGCVSRGWTTYKEHFGTLFVSFIVAVVVILGALMVLGGIVGLVVVAAGQSLVVREVSNLIVAALLCLVSGPMMGGVYKVYLKALRKQTPSVNDAFSGFGAKYKNLVLGNLIVSMTSALWMLPYRWVSDSKIMPILLQMQHAQPADLQTLLTQMIDASTSSLPVLLVTMIPLTYFSVNMQFTVPLIMDKQLGAWEAVKASWKMVHRHWWYMFGMTVVVGLVLISGVVGCCIGVIFTVPLAIAAMMAAYEIIFGFRQE